MSYHGNYSFADSRVVRVFCFGNFRHVSQGLTMLIDIFFFSSSFFFPPSMVNTIIPPYLWESWLNPKGIENALNDETTLFHFPLFSYFFIRLRGLSSKRFLPLILFRILEMDILTANLIIHTFIYTFCRW